LIVPNASNIYVVIRTRGAGWKAGAPLEAQADWTAHAEFMDSLESEGAVLLAGPLENSSDVLIVMRAESPEVIEARLAEDIWTQNGMLATTRISPWILRIGAFRFPQVTTPAE
jgi:uncharacterized protein YciI